MAEVSDEDQPGHVPARSDSFRLGWWAWASLPVALAAVYAFWARSERVQKVESTPAKPGWEELGDCVSAQSLDGKRSIEFLRDGRAELRDTSIDKQQPVGQWSYDETSKRYALNINGQTVLYELVSRSDPDFCILVKGDLSAADLRSSWFAVGPPDDPD